MGWLRVTDEQRAAVAALNQTSIGVGVGVVRGALGGWLACDDAIPYAVAGGSLEHFAEWYASLAPADDIPVRRHVRPKPDTRP